jgi:hypothetical protein
MVRLNLMKLRGGSERDSSCSSGFLSRQILKLSAFQYRQSSSHGAFLGWRYNTFFSLLIDNNLTLHSSVAEPASMAAPKCVRSRCLGQKLNCRCFSLFELPTILCRGDNQPRLIVLGCPIKKSGDLKTMIMVRGGDFELYSRAPLHVNRLRGILVFFGGDFDHLDVLILGCSPAARQTVNNEHQKREGTQYG